MAQPSCTDLSTAGVDSAPPASPPRILLAPMEGLLDHLLREELTALGGVDGAVSEFIRITDQLMPRRVFTRIVPELLRGGQTEAGTPVRPQLLGSDPVCLAENAARLAELNPPGIDLNFGCPAKCVNRHRGGAVLLDEPDLLHVIVQEVRRAVPSRIPVSAKMRLGNEDSARMLDCARALASGGAAELVVHARTKRQGYKPPAYWAEIGNIRAAVSIPLIANGEIWTVRDALQARAESGCADLMLGRGAVADPSLPLALRAHDVGLMSRVAPWADLVPSLWSYWARVQGRVASKHQAGRLKQWLHYLRRTHTEAETVYQAVRAVQAPAAFEQALRAALPPPAVGAISPCQKMQQGEALSVATST